MPKEQTLLLAAVVIGGLVVWSATGKYTEVGAATLPAGKDVPIVKTVQPDPTAGLAREPLKGRPLATQVRPEKRPPLPDIPAPAAMPYAWVRPVPTPAISSDHWRPLRGFFTPFKVEETAAGTNAAEPTANVDEPAAPVNPLGPKPKDVKKEAQLVPKSGDPDPIIIELTGDLKGQPDWVVLEKWPDLSMTVQRLDRNGRSMGPQPLTPAELANYVTVHLKKTLKNEFHEERIRRGVRDVDRSALMSFAKWVWETLPSHSSDDNVPYGLDAKRMAIEVLEKAKLLGEDLDLVKLLGESYRNVYDLEHELSTYLHYLQGRPNDPGILFLVGDAYERIGAFESARELYERAAAVGDTEAKLRGGLAAERAGELSAAFETLSPLANLAGVGSRALTAMARIRLVQGALDEATTYATQAQKDGATPALSLVLGCIQYARGRFAEAATSFAAGQSGQVTTWRSDRGMALAAAAKEAKDLDPAAAEFQACIDTDPLNLFDPYFGLGDVAQRRGEATKSHDLFETALARAPNAPWILLRLGTVNLQDGQPAKALERGLKLLDVAPGCTEGLWLVGRSAAALDKPDFEKAADHLRRALEKEPENTYFVNEYSRVLVAAGRLDDAIKVLDAATEVQKGVGRSDAKLLGLLAYARFIRGKPILDVYDALNRAKLAQPDDATKEWLAGVKKIIDEWSRTVIWEDRFERTSGTVGGGWTEKEPPGWGIGTDATGRAVFAGKVKQAASTRPEATLLERQEDLARFKEATATFKTQPGVETVFHIYYGTMPDRQMQKRAQGWELGLGCDRNGSMVVWGPTAGKNSAATEIVVKDAQGQPRSWPMDDFHTVRIVRTDDAKGLFELYLDDEKIPPEKGTAWEVPQLGAQTGRQFALGFLVDADVGADVHVEVDSVSVKRTTR